MPPSAHRSLKVALMAGIALGGGCSQHLRAPLTPVPLHLVSSEPFVVHVPATADSLANQCPHLRVLAKVEAVRGDTMYFASVTSRERPKGVRDCVQGREGYLVLSSAPQLRAETGRVYVGRTVLATLVLGFIGAVAVIYVVLLP